MTKERVAALRQALEQEQLGGFIIPRGDEHQGEYVPARAERLSWLTGFTGSAGMAIVLRDKAAIFVDGRYTLQARNQVDGETFEYQHLIEEPAERWLEDNLGGLPLGYDPWLHSEDQIKRLAKGAEKAGGGLRPCEENLVDRIWLDQPDRPLDPVSLHDAAFAGESSEAKRTRLGEALAEQDIAAAVLSLPDSIAWLLNVRGNDVPHTPFALSFALLYADGRVTWFIAPEKVDDSVRSALGNAVSLAAPGELGAALHGLAGKRVRVDPGTAPFWVVQRLEAAGATIDRGPDPCQLPKACKNEAERDGTRAAHRRDGAAVTRFLHWLSHDALAEGASEATAADRLQAFRSEDPSLKDLSFDTISGSGPNGAIVHYRVTPESDRKLASGELFLVDSGGQYPDGTTDVTRTVAIGTPSEEMRRHFTAVLRGHIALATARFPRGTTGHQLDSLARRPLWDLGVDYDHGTGHGVGSYLSVHEGPQRISKAPNRVGLAPGMIVSIEPGYYKEGAYGIRIENLALVGPADESGDEREMLGFETLTFAPIDRTLIVPEMLMPPERAWLDAYHARVRETLAPQLTGSARSWLEEVTAPL